MHPDTPARSAYRRGGAVCTQVPVSVILHNEAMLASLKLHSASPRSRAKDYSRQSAIDGPFKDFFFLKSPVS